MFYKKYFIIFIQLLYIFHIQCYQLKIVLENQVYQFPVNFNLYRRLSEDVRELYLDEYEEPNEKLSLPIININIGIPFQNFSLLYSTGKHLTWVYRDKSNYDKFNQKYFDIKLSKTLLLTKEPIYEVNTYTFGSLGEIAQDYISINNNTSVFMSFMIIFYLSPNSLYADGELGMTRKYLGIYSDPYINKNVSNYSLIDSLYESNKIRKKIFAHKWTSEKDGILYIGEYPLDNEELPYYNFHTCNSTNKRGEINQYWNCYIDGIKIGDKYIDYSLINSNKPYNEIGMFSTSEKFIFIPEHQIDVINYIKNYSKWGEDNCVLEGITAFKELHCKYNTFKYSYFPTVFFNFSGYTIKLNPEDIFYYNDNKKYYRLLIVLYTKKDYWIFGSLLTNKNNMIFDSDNGTVTFFKMKKILYLSSLTYYLLYILIILSSIGFYFIIRIYYIKKMYLKEKNNENNPENMNLIQ